MLMDQGMHMWTEQEEMFQLWIIVSVCLEFRIAFKYYIKIGTFRI